MSKLILSLFVATFLIGCGADKVTKADEKGVAEQSVEKPVDLEKCPCGDSKAEWEEPPPGYVAPK